MAASGERGPYEAGIDREGPPTGHQPPEPAPAVLRLVQTRVSPPVQTRAASWYQLVVFRYHESTSGNAAREAYTTNPPKNPQAQSHLDLGLSDQVCDTGEEVGALPAGESGAPYAMSEPQMAQSHA
eukprot:1148959-Rhodomonas_salina.3